MNAGQLLRNLKTEPFQPFFLHLVDGRSMRIGHPEMLALRAGGQIATIEDTGGLRESIDVLMIVSLRASNDRI